MSLLGWTSSRLASYIALQLLNTDPQRLVLLSQPSYLLILSLIRSIHISLIRYSPYPLLLSFTLHQFSLSLNFTSLAQQIFKFKTERITFGLNLMLEFRVEKMDELVSGFGDGVGRADGGECR